MTERPPNPEDRADAEALMNAIRMLAGMSKAEIEATLEAMEDDELEAFVDELNRGVTHAKYALYWKEQNRRPPS